MQLNQDRAALQPERRVAIVTGGATGIGRATVRAFARIGITAVIAYHSSEDAAANLAAELSRDLVFSVRADITRASEVAALIDRVTDKFGRLDILVNNAGGSFLRCPLTELPQETWDRTLALNLTGPYLCCRAAAKALARQENSAIVNVVSSSAFNGGSTGSVHYASAKAGLVALTKGLAVELALNGIRVNAVAPAAVATDFHSKVPPASPMQSWPSKIPLGRVCAPEEVAEAIVFLATNAASFITGQTIHVNGGMLMP